MASRIDHLGIAVRSLEASEPLAEDTSCRLESSVRLPPGSGATEARGLPI